MAFETKTITECEYGDIEDLIKKVYGQDIELVCELEWNNYSKYSFTVEKNNLEDSIFVKFHQKEFDAFVSGEKLKREFPSIFRAVLVDLAAKGHIPYGELYVEVYW